MLQGSWRRAWHCIVLKASVLRKTIKEKEDIVTLLDKAIAKIEEDKKSCSKAVF